ncbi:MAG: RNA polymerase sigma factor [Phycisphaerae bacterium]|nr:RNA polymerase sigma factor [Phycisphaerae bacterium]
MTKRSNNSELVQQAQQGNRASMNQLSQDARKRLYKYLYRMTMNHDLTEDLMQETLLAMVQSVIDLRKVSRFWPWIYRIAWSKVQQYYRRQHNQPMKYLSDLEPAWQQENLWDSKIEGLEGMVHQEKLDHLAVACDQLGQKYKEVVTLRCFEQLPYEAIAKRTQSSSEQSRLRFFRAKQRLKTSLMSAGAN